MADKSWLSRWFGRTPTQSGTSAQLNESRMTASSPSTSPPTSNDHRQMLRDILPDHGSPISSPPHATNFRSFDPSALNNGHSQKESLFVNTDNLTRKRQFTSSPSSLLPSERIKRFRENIAATKDDEDRVPAFEASVVKPRMEHSFAGPYTQRNASMLESPGGSSSISLFSRRSTAPSTHSNISSKTRAILEQLDRVTTPQTEAKRVPIFRPASSIPEVWNASWHAGTNSTISIANSTSNSQNAPPRKRQPIPTSNRIQMLTSALTTHYKKPYWRDIYRPKKPVEDKPSTPLQSPAIQRVQATSNSVVKVSPLFDLSGHQPATSSAKEGGSATVSSVKAVPPLKGFDGKKVPNTFNAGCIYMEDSDGEQEKDSADVFVKRLDLPKVAPPKGFINDCLFDFEAPVERGPQANVSSSSDESSPESESSNSSDDVELNNEVQTKVTEKFPVAPAIKIVTETLAPPTDSETSASVVATPNSSKNASPESLNKTPTTATVSKWYCSICMLDNQAASTKCIACQAPKPGETTTASATTSKWFCSMCLLENQATSNKCVACESPKPGETAPAAPALTFKPITFAPVALPPGLSFGVVGSKAPEAPLANKDDSAEVKQPLFKAGAVLSSDLNTSTALKPALAPSTQTPATKTNGFTFAENGFGGAPSTDSTSTLGLPKPAASTPFSLSAATAPATSLKFGGIGSDTVSKGLNDGAASSTPALFTLGSNNASAPITNSFTFTGVSSIPSVPLFHKTTDVVPETDSTQRKDTDKPFAPSKAFWGTTVSLTDTKTPASIFAASSLSKNNLLENLNQTPTTTPAKYETPKSGETATASTSTFKPNTFTSMAPSSEISFGFTGSKAPEIPSRSNDGAPDMKRPLFGPGPTTTPSLNFGPAEGAKLAFAPSAQPAQTQPLTWGSNGFGGASSASAPTLSLPQTTTSGPFSLSVPTAPPTSFNFAPSTAPFVFGHNAAPAPAPAMPMTNSFSFIGNSSVPQIPTFGNAPPSDSPFAFNSSSTTAAVGPAGRKLASARRRLTHKR